MIRQVFFITSVVLFSHGLIRAQYPANYDLPLLGRVTPVNDQGSTCGSCWAFASCASIESSLLTQGLSAFNLSEDQLIDCHGFDEAPCYGGSYYMTQAFLSMHKGPVSEIADPYTPSTQNRVNNYPFPPTPIVHEEEMRFIPASRDSIKSNLINYGAVASTMFFNMANYTTASFKYYDPVITSVDSQFAHCVTIVGWSDTMNFPGATNPGGWIIKDSYGTNWADSGYFYCSYDDASILSENVVFPTSVPLPVTEIAHVYGLDDFGWVDNFGFNSTTSCALTKYTLNPTQGVVKPQIIKRVGSYGVADDMTLTFDLYHQKNVNILSDLIASESVYCPHKGFYTVPISTTQDSLHTDVYAKVTYQSHSGESYPIPIEVYEANHTSGLVLAQNQGWVSLDGSVWAGTGQGTNYTFDLCIKLYTQNTDPLSIVDKQNDGWKLYPNPTEASITIVNENKPIHGETKILVSDLAGRKVEEFLLFGEINALDVSNLNKGLYLVQIIRDGQISVLSFKKQ